MQWGFRWYGEGDTIPLTNIRQIPGMHGIVGTLLNKMPGDVWEISEINALKASIEKEHLSLLGIESVAIHDAIKAGTEERDHYIDQYIQTIRNLAACDVHMICYSFKPIFGWAKTNLFYQNEDGSFSLLYDQAVVDDMEPSEMYTLIHSQSKGFKLPGWEEERLKKFQRLMATYEGVTQEILFDNLSYFLKRIIPVCEEVDVKMAIHPDDPPWEIFGLPRITKNLEDLKKIMAIVDSPYNGVTLCTGSLGADPENDMVEIVHGLKGRINFVHFRNVLFMGERKFKESAHLSTEGSLDMYAIMKALVDRAIGISYLQGLHEAVLKEQMQSRGTKGGESV